MAKSDSIGICYALWKKENQTILNPLTFRRYTHLLETHLLPYFENVSAEDITMEDIEVFLSRKQKENMSPVTLNMLLMLFKRLLQIAGIDIVKLGLEQKVKIHTSRKMVEIMEEQEQYFLERILNISEEPKHLGIVLAFKMGLSIGEICALQWEDINFEEETVQIKNMVQRIQNKNENGKKTLLVKMPLSKSALRKIPVPKSVMQILVLNRESQGYVLKCKEGGIPDPRREQMRLQKFFKKQQMKEYNFHTLRDTFAVRCLKAGMSIENLSYVLGHANVSITAERYKMFIGNKENQITILRRIMEGV